MSKKQPTTVKARVDTTHEAIAEAVQPLHDHLERLESSLGDLTRQQNPRDATASVVADASHHAIRRAVEPLKAHLERMEKRVGDLTKRVDTIESLIDRGLGKFPTP